LIVKATPWKPQWQPQLLMARRRPTGRKFSYTVFGMPPKKHDDTRLKLQLDIEQALRKAVDAGPYPDAAPKSRPSRSSPRTKAADRQFAPKAD